MNILHININYIGTELHQNLIECLDSMGIQNQVFAPTYNASLSVIKPNNNVVVKECFRKWDRLSFYYKQKKIYASLKENIDLSKIELIHAYTLFSDGNVAYRLKNQYGIPYVVAIRDTDVNDFFRLRPHLKKRGIKILENASKIFFLSPAYQKTVMDKYVPKQLKEKIVNKSEVIPNGIDEIWFRNLHMNNKNLKVPIKLIYVGQICKRKNIETTIRAIRILQEKGYEITFTVIGRCVNLPIYNRIKLEKDVLVLPPKSKEELIDYYRENEIFVMPSFTETFGLVYAEALSQGLPIVYTRKQGFDGQFEEGVVGYSVKANDAENVAEGIEKVIKNYDRLQVNCVDAANKFRWGKIASKYLSIYNDILRTAEKGKK